MMEYRIENDSLGNVNVPKEAYWGSQAERSRGLFQVSGITEHSKMIDAYVMLKKACAEVNTELGLLEPKIGQAIVLAADEILKGHLRDQFPVDVFHMGAGTSLNMNVNEVLANRAEEILGGVKGQYSQVNPNNHVNFGQSTNDTFPTAMRMMSRFITFQIPLENTKPIFAAHRFKIVNSGVFQFKIHAYFSKNNLNIDIFWDKIS